MLKIPKASQLKHPRRPGDSIVSSILYEDQKHPRHLSPSSPAISFLSSSEDDEFFDDEDEAAQHHVNRILSEGYLSNPKLLFLQK